MKRILLGKTMNTRDLGGFPCPSGYTRHLRLLRSDRPKGLGKEDISLYYRVVVIKAPLQGLCYTVRDAVDW